MKKLFKSLISAGVIMVMLLASSPVSADAAVVFNSGRDGLICTIAGVFNGLGDATLVSNDGGQVMFSCHGVFDEVPPAEAIRFSAAGPLGTVCWVVVTPGGNFNARCHN